MTEMTYAWSPITKTDTQPDGTLMVYGPAISAGLDRDQQRFSQTFIDRAMPEWLSDGGNVREQHDPHRAVGVAVGLAKGDDGAALLTAKIVDPVAVAKINHGVLRGFSVGVRDPRITMGKADAPGGVIEDGTVVEVSVVDRPCNPAAMFAVAKVDSSGQLAAVADAQVVEHVDAPAVKKRDIPQAERDADAKSGAAMPDGSYPIRSKGDLRNAIKAVGRGGADHDAIRRHIIARAKSLGLTDMIPDNWGADGSLKAAEKADTPTEEASVPEDTIGKSEDATVPVVDPGHAAASVRVLAALAEMGYSAGLDKADMPADAEGARDETADITGAHDAIKTIADLIIREATSLGMGQLDEAWDIDILLRAVEALKVFIRREQDEAAGNAAAAAIPAAVELAETPDLVKTTGTPSGDPVEPKAGITKADIADLIKTAIAEASTAAEERENRLAEQVSTLKADLVKAQADLDLVKAMPEPGGPVLTRTTQQAQQARVSDAEGLRREAAALLTKADVTTDPMLREGYRARANAALDKADSIA